MLQKKAEWFIY